MRNDDDDEQLKIELLSQWKLEAESRNIIDDIFKFRQNLHTKLVCPRLDTNSILTDKSQ